ncbi:hypothetical protein MKX03_035028 [Papaver bracteatum]|nr:hypothetical protein MKX03_035028 [Papaver bracteatum]
MQPKKIGDIGASISIRMENLIANSIKKKLEFSAPHSCISGECSIHRVPEKFHKMREPSAYKPGAVSIGPYHRANQSLKATKDLKLLYAHNLLTMRAGRESSNLHPRKVEDTEEETRTIKLDSSGTLVATQACFAHKLPTIRAGRESSELYPQTVEEAEEEEESRESSELYLQIVEEGEEEEETRTIKLCRKNRAPLPLLARPCSADIFPSPLLTQACFAHKLPTIRAGRESSELYPRTVEEGEEEEETRTIKLCRKNRAPLPLLARPCSADIFPSPLLTQACFAHKLPTIRAGRESSELYPRTVEEGEEEEETRTIKLCRKNRAPLPLLARPCSADIFPSPLLTQACFAHKLPTIRAGRESSELYLQIVEEGEEEEETRTIKLCRKNRVPLPLLARPCSADIFPSPLLTQACFAHKLPTIRAGRESSELYPRTVEEGEEEEETRTIKLCRKNRAPLPLLARPCSADIFPSPLLTQACFAHKLPTIRAGRESSELYPRIVEEGEEEEETRTIKLDSSGTLVATQAWFAIVGECVSSIREMETKIRKCYSEPVDLINSEEFVEMMIIDGLFIIKMLIRSTFDRSKINKIRSTFESYDIADDPLDDNDWLLMMVQQDMFLLENQIPLFVLQCLANIIFSAEELGRMSLNEVIHSFITTGNLQHILPTKGKILLEEPPNRCEDSNHLLDFLIKLFQPPAHVAFSLDTSSHFFLPSATELSLAGVRFKKGSAQGSFLDIKFIRRTGILEIPPLRIFDETDPLLRNLIAFEQSCGGDYYITSYVTMMDFLINSADDVRLLRKRGIISNYLGCDEDVSDMFNKLCVGINDGGDYYSNYISDMNKFYKKRRHIWKATLKREYFNTPWAIVSFLAAVLLIALTIISTVSGVLSIPKS